MTRLQRRHVAAQRTRSAASGKRVKTLASTLSGTAENAPLPSLSSFLARLFVRPRCRRRRRDSQPLWYGARARRAVAAPRGRSRRRGGIVGATEYWFAVWIGWIKDGCGDALVARYLWPRNAPLPSPSATRKRSPIPIISSLIAMPFFSINISRQIIIAGSRRRRIAIYRFMYKYVNREMPLRFTK